MKKSEKTVEEYLKEINEWDWNPYEIEDQIFSKPLTDEEKELIKEYKF